jgi:SH3 domain protein
MGPGIRHWPLLTIVLLAFATHAAEAQTRYISDEFFVPFRTGPSTQNAITRNLVSGTRIEIVEEREDAGYARVRLQDGTEGWVQSQYLQPEPIAEARLQAATRELSAARGQVADLEQRIAELTTSLATTTGDLSEARSQGEQAGAELADVRAASAEALQTRAENENLRRRVAELESAAETASLQIDELRGRERQNWFIIGAAVLLGGIVIGLVAPTLRRKRRSSW